MVSDGLPQHASVVIVGGGVMGVSAAYHLACGGQTDISRAVFSYNHADWYVREVLDLTAVSSGDLGPALAEVASGDGDDAVARRRQVRDHGLETGRSRGRVQQDLVARTVDLFEALEHLLVGRPEVGAAVMDDRKRQRGEHLRWNRRRPRRHQIALLGQAPVSLAQPQAISPGGPERRAHEEVRWPAASARLGFLCRPAFPGSSRSRPCGLLLRRHRV